METSVSYGCEFYNLWELIIRIGVDHSHFLEDYTLNLNGQSRLVKEIIGLDTGGALSDFTNKNYNFESINITPVVIISQAFNIHNISSIVQLGMLYSISNNMSIQSDFRMRTPLQNIYKDQIFIVRTRQFQLGISLIYTLPKVYSFLQLHNVF